MSPKLLCNLLNKASADRCLRNLGALMALASSEVKGAIGWDESDIVAHMFTNRQTAQPREYRVQGCSGNCCRISITGISTASDGMCDQRRMYPRLGAYAS